MEEKDFTDLDKQIELAKQNVKADMLENVIDANAKNTSNVKETIDLFATKTALKEEQTVEKIVFEKQAELQNDAETKRIQAETARIKEEVSKVKQESEKEIAELEKTKNRLQAEVEQMRKESDKANAYFDANKDILKCAGITKPKTLKVMQGWLWIASIIFAIIQIIKLPITITGALLEGIVDIVGGVCGAFKNNAIKIVIGVIIVIIIIGAIFGTVFGIDKLIKII